MKHSQVDTREQYNQNDKNNAVIAILVSKLEFVTRCY